MVDFRTALDATLGTSLVQPENSGAQPTELLDQLVKDYMPEKYARSMDPDDTLSFQRMEDAIGFPPAPVKLTKSTYTISGTISINNFSTMDGVVDRGVTIQHANGYSAPLFNLTGGTSGTPMPARPAGGFRNVKLSAGDSTAYCIYVEGQIDNNTVWNNLIIDMGSCNNPNGHGISVRDYLNFHSGKVRYDRVPGYGMEVRNAQYFAHSVLSVDDWTYDNGNASNYPSGRGKGMLYINATGLTSTKGIVAFRKARIELNTQLLGSHPTRSLFRIEQNGTYASTLGAQVNLHFGDITIVTDPAVKDVSLVTANTGRVGLYADNVESYGLLNLHRNDDGSEIVPFISTQTAVRIKSYSSRSLVNDQPGMTQISGINGIVQATYDTDSNFAQARTQEGDIVYMRQPRNMAGRTGRIFAAKDVTPRGGIHAAQAGVSVGTGTVTSGALGTLTLTGTISARFVPNLSIVIAGAGTASANLTTLVTDYDQLTGIATISPAASTAVTNAAITLDQAQYMWSECKWRGTSPPTASSGVTYQVGDEWVNSSPISRSNPVVQWVCTTTGDPGNWAPDKFVTFTGSTANRPVLGVNDQGVRYRDTTLAVNGKPIEWTGTIWVDGTGASV